MEISIKWNICRVCLQEEHNDAMEGAKGSSRQMQHLFSADKKLALHIYELSGISMKPNDSLPDKICHKCMSIVNKAVQFRKTCRTSNVYLQSILERAKSASTLIKPEIESYQFSDDDFEDDNMETQVSAVLGKRINKLQKRINNITEYHESKEHDLVSVDNIQSLEHEPHKAKQEVNDMPDYKVELEEIIEVSEELEDQMFTQRSEEDGSEGNSQTHYITQDIIEESNIKECGTPQLQKFYMNTSFTKFKNINLSENSCSDNDLVESDRIEKDSDNENSESINDNECFKDFEDSVLDEDLEYDALDDDIRIETDIEESLMMDLGEDINESQPQVSSSVDANDEVEYYENNSYISNPTSNIDEKGLMLDTLTNCNISSTEHISGTNSNRNETDKKSTHSTGDKIKNHVIFARRKMKRNLFKSTTIQVCVCHICGNQFSNRSLMNSHMKVHLQTRNHQCELCFKRFITACNLQAHMRIHTGERPFECKYCGRRFNDRSSNLRHERTHTNEKPFECSDCGKTFTLATTLQNHMKVHTNERLYRCEPCGKSFKLSHHLKTHQNTSLHRSVLQIVNKES